MVVRLADLSDTEELARKLARALPRAALVLLEGGLGSGKTTFVKFLASALGFDSGSVSSPSFTIVQSYRSAGAGVLHHVDLYRIESEAELPPLGLEEILDGEDPVAVEWPAVAERVLLSSGRPVVRLRFSAGPVSREVDTCGFAF